jgi:hypothetical protein
VKSTRTFIEIISLPGVNRDISTILNNGVSAADRTAIGQLIRKSVFPYQFVTAAWPTVPAKKHSLTPHDLSG